ncbi:MAG TPA: hypothetical protein VNP73_08285 [Actinomycetota bacterium]|nr:hypothetical protein [Actinomycetota bacterium]
MHPDRRVVSILALLALIAIPAAVLRVLCLGRACEEERTRAAQVPFCSLPASVRDRIAAGYRDGRSPDVLAVTEPTVVLTAGSSSQVARDNTVWPALGDGPDLVPIVFYGHGVATQGSITAGIEDISPTAAEIIGFDIPHPEVRAGRPVEGVASGDPPRLFVYVILEGASPEDLATARFVRERSRDGAGTFDGAVASLPLDPAAIMATIGTGGLPVEHGITGSLVRDDDGRVGHAWNAPPVGPVGPGTVIATLADDLDEDTRQRSLIGLLGRKPQDRGLIGGEWYIDVDEDYVEYSGGGHNATLVAESFPLALRTGFGRDEVPDLFAVVLSGTVEPGTKQYLGKALADIERAANDASGGSAAFVLTSLPVGGTSDPDTPVSPGFVPLVKDQIGTRLDADVVEASVAGGFFLDQDALAQEEISRQEVIAALRSTEIGGEPVFADAFPGFAVALARFC